MNDDGRTPAIPPADQLDGPPPPDAAPATRALYDEIAATLRVPYLGPFWRALAWDEYAAGRIWSAAGPLMATRAFEREARALREAALIEEAVSMPSHQAFKADLVRAEVDFEMRERLGNYNALVHYALPKTLLAATWLLNPPAERAPDAADDGTIPLGVAAGAVAVTPAPPAQVRGRLAELLDEIPRAHGHPIADEYFRAIGRATDYLNASWNALKVVVRDEPYDERARDLTRRADDALTRLPPRPADLDPFPDRPDDAARLRAVFAYFARRHLPDLLIDVAVVKGITDGPDRAQEQRYDLEP